MTTPSELLEQALVAHGDTLYRVALLAATEERRAEQALRATVAALVANPPSAPLDEAELVARLLVAQRTLETQATSRRPSAPAAQREPAPPALFRSLLGLPREQRLASGLHLLLGYDVARLARVLELDEAAARATLIDAIRALGPAAGNSLTDRVSGDDCAAIRDRLVDPALGTRHSQAVRGHLASCAPCRSFDYTWSEIVQAVEAALRAALRERKLPAALETRLLAMARPARRMAHSWARYRFVLPPLAVLALIAALVLPGFGSRAVDVVEQQASAPVDPQALLAQALARQERPPPRDGVWHARYETLWYFDENTYAPIVAELWQDAQNAARHRLQLTHAAGGAPYELQVGDGQRLLHYALDSSYATTLYSWLPMLARSDQPVLLSQRLDGAGQERAMDERLRTGPWTIPPFYLRQARAASDLRVLGRQRDGDQTVQIMSFSGISPFGHPPESPGATAERVTVLLALDSEEGLLRSATELSGPPGGTQISRVTWRLVEDEWLLTNTQVGQSFAISRAWNGVGDFAEIGLSTSADLAVPLISTRDLGDPARLLSHYGPPFWLPAAPPAGVERALLLWAPPSQDRGGSPEGLIYLGPERRLVMTFNAYAPLNGGERLEVGAWQVELRPERGHGYSLSLSRPPAVQAEQGNPGDPSANIVISAQGFTRDELLAVVESMRPFDAQSLLAQDALFLRATADEPAARAALLELVQRGTDVSGDFALHIQASRYTRHDPPLASADPLPDPYHLPQNGGLPEQLLYEEWSLIRSSGPTRYSELRPADGGDGLIGWYEGASESWSYWRNGDSSQLSLYNNSFTWPLNGLPLPATTALELLTLDNGRLQLEQQGERRLIRYSEPITGNWRFESGLQPGTGSGFVPFIYDLQPLTMTTELELAPNGELRTMHVYAEGLRGLPAGTTTLLGPNGGQIVLVGREADTAGQPTRNPAADQLANYRVLVQSLELLATERMPLAEAPTVLRNGSPPGDAALTRDYRAPFGRSEPVLHAHTLTETLELATTPFYLLPPEAASFQHTQSREPASVYNGLDTQNITADAVGLDLALRTVYLLSDSQGLPRMLMITQGPAGPLRAFLRSSYVPWTSSGPVRLDIEGQQLQGWLGIGEGNAYLLVELGETLLIAEGDAEWFPNDSPALMAQLRQNP